MGIPRMYANIIQEHPEVVISSLNTDHFFIDFNAMIYQCLPGIVAIEDIKLYASILISHVISTLRNLILTIRPNKSVYIAMDGSVPLGKIIQQRSRRYKSIMEKSYISAIKSTLVDNDSGSASNKWSTAYISPGTVFMHDMSLAIKEELVELKKILDISYTFNPDTVKGEGEHKIIDILRIAHTINKDDTYLVSSPDNDLIVLLLPLKVKTYILKDSKDGEMHVRGYMDVSKFLNTMYAKYSDPQTDKYRFAEDYKFLTFFCGNDFCKPVPYLKVKERSEVIFDEYRKIYEVCREHLIDDNTINLLFLTELIKNISLLELDLLKSIQRKIHRTRKITEQREQRENTDLTEYDIMYNNFQHKPFYSPMNPFYEKYNYLFNKIDYFSDDYNNKYNKFYFDDSIQKVCNEYIRSVQYNLLYYNGYVDYDYAYQYRTAPLFADLAKIDLTKVDLSMNMNSKPLKPFEQLMLILPQQLLYILPKEVSSVLFMPGVKNKLCSDILQIYKHRSEVDVVQGEKWIYSEALLPHITPEHIVNIKTFIAALKFNSKDASRNILV